MCIYIYVCVCVCVCVFIQTLCLEQPSTLVEAYTLLAVFQGQEPCHTILCMDKLDLGIFNIATSTLWILHELNCFLSSLYYFIEISQEPHTCTYTYIHTYSHLYIHTHTHTHINTHTYTHMYTHTVTHIHTHIHIHTHSLGIFCLFFTFHFSNFFLKHF